MRQPLCHNAYSAKPYYPFGMIMPGRSYSGGSGYRFGFNGKEDDNEVEGIGNFQDYGMRMYDSRIGRFMSVDPIAKKYPMLSTYQFASNRPMDGTDMDGLEWMKETGDYYKKTAQLQYYSANQPPKQAYLSQYVPPSDPSYHQARLEEMNIQNGYTAEGKPGLERALKEHYPEAVNGYNNLVRPVVELTTAMDGAAEIKVLAEPLIKSFLKEAPDVIAPATNSGWKGGLDYTNLPEPKNVGPGKPFTEAQLRNAKQLNIQQNNGTLMSDLSGAKVNPSQKSIKGVKPDMNQVEGDHIIQKSQGGTNSNSNLRLVTKKENLDLRKKQ